jgi:hypothetical protein
MGKKEKPEKPQPRQVNFGTISEDDDDDADNVPVAATFKKSKVSTQSLGPSVLHVLQR